MIKENIKPESLNNDNTKSFVSEISDNKAESDIIQFLEVVDPEMEKFINRIMERFPKLSKRIYRIYQDRHLECDGEFTGGMNYGLASYEIALNADLFGKSSPKECQDIFLHEWGHAIYQHVKDMLSFFKKYSLDLPPELQEMSKFITLVSDSKLKDIYKNPRKFLGRYVSLYGETVKLDKKNDPVAEKFAELFLVSEHGSEKGIVLNYKNNFNEDVLNKDFSSYIHDEELIKKWKKVFDRSRRPDQES